MDNQSANPKQAILDRLQSATNILVTVSSDPSVDELAACLGFTLWINKLGKHGTAVFSGQVPSTLEFLQPEDTLEKNTDSLRDFIIALDKSKADKLRYKVEDSVVKIFITPYRTSLSADDLEYSQGDFNVDMVVAMGVTSQQDLDTAITAHGRILHDATVATITVNGPSELGATNWNDGQASSLSELVVELGNSLGRDQIDGQIATALLTGVVAETARFSNEKTTPQTMSVSAELMAAGANQQLVAAKLEEPKSDIAPESTDDNDGDGEDSRQKSEDGTLEIEHDPNAEGAPDENHEDNENHDEPEQHDADEQPSNEPEISDVKQTAYDAQAPSVDDVPEAPTAEAGRNSDGSKFVTEPPSMGGTLTANSRPEDIMNEPVSDPMTLATTDSPQPLLGQKPDEAPVPEAEQPILPQPAPPDWMPAPPTYPAEPLPEPPAAPEPPADQPPAGPAMPEPTETLSDIEQSVHSSHVDLPADINSARDEVMKALNSEPNTSLEPVQALNAQPIDLNPPVEQPQPVAPAPPAPVNTDFNPAAFEIINDSAAAQPAPAPLFPLPQPPLTSTDPSLNGSVEQPFTLPLPSAITPAPANPTPPTSVTADASAPPPVPPPLMPPGFPPAN